MSAPTSLMWIGAGLLALTALPQALHPARGGDPEPAGPTRAPALDPQLAGEQTGEQTGQEICATGCAAVPAPDLELDRAAFDELVRAFAKQPVSGESEALETLLFHGASARAWIRLLGDEALAALDPWRAGRLEAELGRTTARLSVRVTDADGRERFALDRVPVPLGEKQHLFPEAAVDLQLPEISGTVRRVGLDHLWVRL